VRHGRLRGEMKEVAIRSSSTSAGWSLASKSANAHSRPLSVRTAADAG
jgi:hypothetical protein